MNRSERRRQAKQDAKLIERGIDPMSRDPEPTAAMARSLYALFEEAKRSGDIAPPVAFLYSKVDATLRRFRDVPVACKKGCSHCCYIWVSAAAPEVLFISRTLRKMGEPIVNSVNAAHQATNDFDLEARPFHPQPCPLLKENICSVYDIRPKACRFASSADAEICARSYHNLTDEDIPTPAVHLMARGTFAVALEVALQHAGLQHHAYEYNAALARALERADAEQAWLAGEDVFAGVRCEADDQGAAAAITQKMYQYAFG